MPADPLIRRKLARIRSGSSIRYMDLFAGCGGISLGFATAEYKPIASVELDPHAARSHGINFAHQSAGENHEAHYAARDITSTDAADVFKSVGIRGAVDDQVDVLVGGPPCQAFARVGRAKLREQARVRGDVTAEYAFVVDGRVSLWRRYVSYIRELRPVALLMENVPDILNHAGKNIAELVASNLEMEGYVVRYTLMNASWYGVPQTRERMILVGIHRDANIEPVFPVPTHHIILPKGYEGTRNAARRVLLDEGSEHHRTVADPHYSLLPATTAANALADLPPIFAREELKAGRLRRGEKSPREPISYTSGKPSSLWSKLMREWPGFRTSAGTTGHVIRYLPRDYKIFAKMHEGWQYPDIHAEMERRIVRWLEYRQRRGLTVDQRTTEVQDYIHEWRLPYSPSKFPNKWWKMYRDKPVRTLLAHLGKDSYSHIHFDSSQARTISIREAARLQSFPDGFEFEGSGNPALKQIGNAVPPLLAYAIAVALRTTLGSPPTQDIRCRLLGVPTSCIATTAGVA